MSLGGFIRRTFFWTNDYIHGKKVLKHYSELFSAKKKENGKFIQTNNLKRLLHHATSHSKYYKDFAEKKLSEFPVVNKQLLNENHDKIAISKEFIPEQETSNIHIQKTSGSTGTPFAVPQDSRKRYRRIAELKYYGQDVGFKSHEKLGQCRIWTKWQSKGKWQSFKENIIPINVAKMDDDTLTYICDIVKKEKIVSMRAYASWYDKLVDYIERKKINPKNFKTVKVVISSSEALNEDTRVKMKALTGVPIVECYANEENGVLAQQRINDTNYYLNNASYIFEILKLDSDKPAEYGELGRIVVTDLFNYAFPMIRYDTGDTAIMQKGNDISGGWDYISKLYGRKYDLVYDCQGKPMHPASISRCFKNFAEIHQWQFIQKDKNDYLLKLNATTDIDLEKIIQETKSIIGNGNISIEFVDDIPVLASGKRKPVICEWKKNE